ncbi:MAG: N-acetylmuramoyl-L-alanine amidase [Erysipelotrichaceae bacterium]
MRYMRINFKGKKYKIYYVKLLIVLGIILALILAILVGKNMIFGTCNYAFKACSVKNDQIIDKLIQTKNEEVVEIKDYYFYGENLVLSNKVIDVPNYTNDLAKAKIVLVNICNEKEVVFDTGSEVDNFIKVNKLPVGLYQLYVDKDGKRSQIISSEKISDGIYTVTRNGKNNFVQILSDEKLFVDENQKEALDKKYVFIKVEEKALPNDVFDIVIDPNSSYDYQGQYDDKLININGLVEKEQNLLMAKSVKTLLEKDGYKVKLTSSNLSEELNLYGADGRIHRSYGSHAKYYVEIKFNYSDNVNTRGTQVIRSHYASEAFSGGVLKEILTDTKLINSGNRGSGTTDGVLAYGLQSGYDTSLSIRETGGTGLQAGKFSSYTKEQNGAFAQTRLGLNSISIEYIYITNSEDSKIWQAENEKIAVATAKGIKAYLQ